MVDWEKQILENRRRKQQEKERSQKVEEEHRTATETNRTKAISFISNVAVPAFEKAKKVLEGSKLRMCVRYTKLDGDTSIEMEVSEKEARRTKSQPFRYRVEMEYTSSSVTPYVVCSLGKRHKIEKTNNDSAIPKMSFELTNITADDIYKDLMECFSKFDDKH